MSLPKEDLLQHIWKFRLFEQNDLFTVDGRPLQVLRPGTQNTDAGPDFTNARIRLDGTEWAGNIELHVRTSDWFRHGHTNDVSYSNLILHVVFEHDVNTEVGPFATLELKGHISDQVLSRYRQLMASSQSIPCGSGFMQVNDVVRQGWLETLLVQRLVERSQWMSELIDHSQGDLEQAFQHVVFRAFGSKVNAEGFLQLSQALPWKVLAKHADDLFQLEALLFGTAGFLETELDGSYHRSLRQEFNFLRHKYALTPVNANHWKFLRMRPANFPTIRLAQLAALIHYTGPLLKFFSAGQQLGKLSAAQLKASDHWNTHYRFGTESTDSVKHLGASMLNGLMVNAVIPFLFVMADREGDTEMKTDAMEQLRAVSAEKNARISVFTDLGFRPRDAADTQALLQLRTQYCDGRKCLFCRIGAEIISNKHEA